jgi:hypothetical protein
MRALVSLFLLTALPLAGASAQPANGAPQSSTTTAEDVTEAAPQISRGQDRGLAQDQLSSARSPQQPLTQVSRSARNASAPQPLSDPSAGRTAAVEPVTGKDRCDPARLPQMRSKLCKDVIEGRANDFQRQSATELSPEQRLLLTRELQGAGRDVANATQRLGKTGETDDNLEMGIAATVLKQGAPPAKTETETNPKIDAATQAIINAILVNPGTPH